MDDMSDARIPISEFPRLAAEVERLLSDPERIKATDAHRKTFRRLLEHGMPGYFRPFINDGGLARALCADLEQRAA